MKRTHGFDLFMTWADESVRVTGDIIPGCAATGPTYDCGGTPAEGPEIDDFRAYRADGSEIEDTDKMLEALFDGILEAAAEYDGEDD